MTSNTKLFDGVVIFAQVVELGSFTAAAEATGHSTSYISKEINKLEARLGLRLLNRTTRSISLTPDGDVYFQQCLQMINDAEEVVGQLNQSDVSPKGLLKISCPVSFGIGYLQPVLSEFMKEYPDITLELDLNDRHIDIVQQGFDLAIRATGNLEESSLICRKIYHCKGLTVASKDYLEKHGIPSKPEQLIEHRCLCYSNHKIPNRWLFHSQEGKAISVDVKNTITCNSSELELAMVLAGHGICRLPEFAMEAALQSGQLAVLFESYQQPDIDVYVIYPSRKHLSAKVRSFIDFLVQRMPS